MADVSESKFDEIQGEILHEYDGIQEADNELPTWWLGTFYGAIVFAIFYWFYFHEYEIGSLPNEAYAAEMSENAGPGSEVPESVLLEVAADPASVTAGSASFDQYCVPCHAAQAEGNIGPNLTDGFWLHGGSPQDIHRVIYDGVLTKGMPAWGASLGAEAAQELTAFVLSVRDTNVEGKAAEGEPWAPSVEGEPDEEPAAEAEPDGNEEAAPTDGVDDEGANADDGEAAGG